MDSRDEELLSCYQQSLDNVREVKARTSSDIYREKLEKEERRLVVIIKYLKLAFEELYRD